MNLINMNNQICRILDMSIFLRYGLQLWPIPGQKVVTGSPLLALAMGRFTPAPSQFSHSLQLSHLPSLTTDAGGGGTIWSFPKSWGYPKSWMVDFMENPNQKVIDVLGKTTEKPFFQETFLRNFGMYLQ